MIIVRIFETVVISPEAAHRIASGTHSESLRQYFRHMGISPTTTDGLAKVAYFRTVQSVTSSLCGAFL